MADRTSNKIFTLGSIKRPVTDIDFANNEPWDNWRDLPEEMDLIIDKGKYTDDLPKLQKSEFHYLFTYGTLKRSFRNHYYLSQSEACGTGYTKDDRYFMANYTCHGYPVAFFDNRADSRARIYGELYKVNADTIKILDNLESNGIIYKRFPLSTTIYDGAGGTTDVRAWIYLGIKDFWTIRSENLQVARRVRPNNGDPAYYIFTLPDEL